jgi:hypothetical protein
VPIKRLRQRHLAVQQTVSLLDNRSRHPAAAEHISAARLHVILVGLEFGLIGRPGRHPIPRHPAARIKRSLQAEATTCRDPREREVSGVLFCGVQALSPATQVLLECVTQQPHCSNISYFAEDAGTKGILVGYVPRMAWEPSSGART